MSLPPMPKHVISAPAPKRPCQFGAATLPCRCKQSRQFYMHWAYIPKSGQRIFDNFGENFSKERQS